MGWQDITSALDWTFLAPSGVLRSSQAIHFFSNGTDCNNALKHTQPVDLKATASTQRGLLPELQMYKHSV